MHVYVPECPWMFSWDVAFMQTHLCVCVCVRVHAHVRQWSGPTSGLRGPISVYPRVPGLGPWTEGWTALAL